MHISGFLSIKAKFDKDISGGLAWGRLETGRPVGETRHTANGLDKRTGTDAYVCVVVGRGQSGPGEASHHASFAGKGPFLSATRQAKTYANCQSLHLKSSK